MYKNNSENVYYVNYFCKKNLKYRRTPKYFRIWPCESCDFTRSNNIESRKIGKKQFT